jgi:hypothetical protein
VSLLSEELPQSLNRLSKKSPYFGTKENQQLAQLRDWLLPLLMNGQVTVA